MGVLAIKNTGKHSNMRSREKNRNGEGGNIIENEKKSSSGRGNRRVREAKEREGGVCVWMCRKRVYFLINHHRTYIANILSSFFSFFPHVP